jgi:tripartite-type tricarboxylate transporter receptor subunit TctC
MSIRTRLDSRLKIAALLGGLFMACLPLTAQSQTSAAYPSRPISVVVPFAAGGPADLVGRAVTTRMSPLLGQALVIDNRGGAGGALGTVYAAQAAPTGYTLVIANPGSHGTAPLVQRDVAYDPVAQFTPVVLLGSSTFVLLCNPMLPVQTARELIDYAKRNPGKVTYGSAGVGSNVHFIGEYFKLRTGTDMVHVPYKGAGPMINDLLSGTINCTFDSASKQYISSGRLRALGLTTDKRDPLYPGVPTLEESGVADFNIASWQALLAPKDTPPEIVDKLNKAANQVLKQQETIDQLAAIGFHARGGSAEEMRKLLAHDRDMYREIHRAAKMDLQ